MNFTKGLLKSLCILFIVGILNLFLCPHNAGAVSYSGSSYINSTGCSLVYNNGGSITLVPYQGGCHQAASGISNTSGVRYLAIRFSPDLQIPANSIVAITVKIKTDTYQNPSYPQVGWTTKSLAYSLIDSSMGEYGTNYSYFYFSQAISGEIDLFPSTPFANFSFIDISVSSISYTTLDYQPTRGQITQLQNTLSDINSKSDITNSNLAMIREGLSTTNSNLEIIRGKLDDIMSNSDRTADVIEEQQQQDEQDRSDLEQQTSNTDDSADQLQSDVESATSNISANISSIVGAFSTGPTDCIISITSGPNGVFTMNSMNLCQVPNEMHQLIHNILSIIVTISVFWTSFSLLSQFLSIYENYLGAGGIRH